MKSKKYLNIDELAIYISSTKSTIYTKKCRNQIPYTKIGRRLLFDVDEINEWIINGGNIFNAGDLPKI